MINHQLELLPVEQISHSNPAAMDLVPLLEPIDPKDHRTERAEPQKAPPNDGERIPVVLGDDTHRYAHRQQNHIDEQ